MSDTPKVHIGEIISGSEIVGDREDGFTVQPVEKPMVFGTYPGLTKCLMERGECARHIHCFRSGGGLRVVSIEDNDEKRKQHGYGEHPHIEEAMNLCEEDYLAGRRKYSDVYGKLVPNYFTGSSTPSSKIDEWTLTGQSWDIYLCHDKQFAFKSEYYYQLFASEERQKRILETGKEEIWESPTTRYTYRAYKTSIGNIKACVASQCISKQKDKGDSFMPKKIYYKKAPSIAELLSSVTKDFESIHLIMKGE
jgi:hypothetical protein